MADAQTAQVQTETRGAVPEDMAGFAVHQVSSLLRAASEPVLFARVKLIMSADPAVEHPAIAQVSIDLNGRLVRAQAAGGTMREAVEHACGRLRIRLQRAARNWEAVRGGRPVPGPGEWRHQSLPAPRLPYIPRPPGERTIVRHKSYALARQTPDEAAADAELLDYDLGDGDGRVIAGPGSVGVRDERRPWRAPDRLQHARISDADRPGCHDQIFRASALVMTFHGRFLLRPPRSRSR